MPGEQRRRRLRDLEPRARATAIIVITALLGAVTPTMTSTALTSTAAEPTVKMIYAAPEAHGTRGTKAQPCSLARAQAHARRLAAAGHSVVVTLAGGRYELAAPLRFDARDSGVGDATVTYRAAPGERPVLTGASKVRGWTRSSIGDGIWRARTPVGLDTRQLYVDEKLAPRASIAVDPSAIALNRMGFTIKDQALQARLARVADPSRLELQSVASFTNRYLPVKSVAGAAVTMAQPSWDNNTFGYDVVQQPFRTPEFSLENAPELLSAAGQWAIVPSAGRLYYRAGDGVNPNTLDVELPRLESVLQVAGTYDAPARNLVFEGLTFTGTSWMHPSTDDGFASQQTGTYVTGVSAERPADAFDTCRVGCSGFESTRAAWGMIAGAVQVSAATNIDFADNVFVNLGSQGLGIGNDGGANASGVDLGARNITVTGNRFEELAGGGIIVGGSRLDAHHPSRPEMTNSDIVIDNNVIHDIGIDYKDQDGVFATYVDGLTVSHNLIYNQPYSAIGVGFGWGAWDAGGSQVYEDRGTYEHWPRYATPTVARDYRIVNNRMDNVVTRMNDAACIYTLGSVPGSLIDGNYCTDLGNDRLDYSWPVYLDEASRYWTVSNNVFLGIPDGLHTNRAPSGQPNSHLTAVNNYLSANAATEDLTRAPDSTSTNLVAVHEPNVPLEASRIIFGSGLRDRAAADDDHPPVGAQLSVPDGRLGSGQSVTVTAALENFDTARSATAVSTTLTGPEGWTVTPAPDQPDTIRGGDSVTAGWTVTAPERPTSSAPQEFTATIGYTYRGVPFTATRTVTLAQKLPPVTSLSTFAGGGAAMEFGELDGSHSMTGYSGDTMGLFGIDQDSYGTIYEDAAAGTTSTVTARVTAYDQVVGSSKAGIVLRNDLTEAGTGQGYVSLMVQSEGVTLFNDSNGDGKVDEFYPLRSGPTTGPLWLRLTRDGGSVKGSYSADGVTWTVLAQTLTLNNPTANLDAGLIYVPDTGTTPTSPKGTASFDSFSVE
ncbi:NEW3 domain-containing protein [Promicromonospora sp. NPDC023805]|uniref:NEW3 domain-containing protein n=1 Tax=Promicromonospora sp. NPDC023805 TaxID=3154696 RepID=UPI0033CD470D